MARRPGSTQRGYGYQWQKAAAHFLRKNILCVMCERDGHRVPAKVVDHITPHKGDDRLFWDETNWQALCKACHDGRKQSLERLGYEKGVDFSGKPLDPAHPWNVKEGNS